jgi:HSP20 family molecular chaperone IbpA
MPSLTSSHYSVYPGEFIPETNEEEIKKHMEYVSNETVLSTSLSLKELTNSYAIDVVAPGLKRDEVVVYGNDHSLFVCSTQDKKKNPGFENFEHHIVLPLDADAEFSVAEYDNSVLHFYVPKTKQHEKHTLTRIVVY